jgi:[acyl-carrier-protein] S-malonyltransferase
MRTAWIFPGQGSQKVGMGGDLCKEFPRAEAILEEASDLSGYPLREFCHHGPRSVLARTDILQPALTAISLACVELLREHGHEADVVAGHSLGEFAAMYAAGVLSLTDTLSLVATRGRLMHRASQEVPGGMISVNKLSCAAVAEIAESGHQQRGCWVANFNAPDQTVLSGTARGLEAATIQVAKRGGRATPLDVSGPWHSPLLQQIVHEFSTVVHRVHFNAPRMPLFMNVTGRIEQDPLHIRSLVLRQLVSPVLWYPIIQRMEEHQVSRWLEIGPGKTLRGLLRHIFPDTPYEAHGIATARNVHTLGQPTSPLAVS